ncbi:MAG: LysR family transcriptional regulator [Oscillospiraceae bacterium]|nr:LysR family transcriptional regulator [Oscillospiraceae bacterium]
MDFRNLQYFVTVAQELNFTRAAGKLQMSQPPLSNQIKALEEELGVQLFVRGKRHMTLTDAGVLLLQRAVQILEMGEKTRRDLASMGNELSGTICLGMVEGRAPYLAARWIAGFREEYPLVRYELWNGSSDDVLDQLHRGLADLAVIAAPYDEEHLDGFVVGREPWVAMISRRHPLADLPGTELPLSSLVGQPLIIPRRKSRVEAIRRWFAGIGAEPDILCEMSNYMDAVALAEQNVGISIFPQTTYTPNAHVVSKLITQPARQVEYVLVWERNQHLKTNLVREFTGYVRDFIEADLIHSPRFQVAEGEFLLPEDTENL